MRMIRLLYVEAGGEKKQSAGRLDASEGGEDFCWMLFQLSARSLSLPLSLQHKHTSIAFFFFFTHTIDCMCPSKCFANFPQAWKPIVDTEKIKYPAALQLHQGAIIKNTNEWKEFNYSLGKSGQSFVHALSVHDIL